MAAVQQQDEGSTVGDGQAVGELCSMAVLSAAVASLQHLDSSALQRRWRTLIGGAPPRGLGRPLILRMLAFKLQAERLGDLDKSSRRALEAVHDSKACRSGCASVSGAAPLTKAPAAAAVSTPHHRVIRPGTLLTREHGGVLHRVKVLGDGFSWDGRTYDSLSKVAFAITGTRWNGPRFFGLRDKPIVPAGTGQARASPISKLKTGDDGRSRSTVRPRS